MSNGQRCNPEPFEPPQHSSTSSRSAGEHALRVRGRAQQLQELVRPVHQVLVRLRQRAQDLALGCGWMLSRGGESLWVLTGSGSEWDEDQVTGSWPPADAQSLPRVNASHETQVPALPSCPPCPFPHPPESGACASSSSTACSCSRISWAG